MAGTIILLLLVGLISARDYFIRWAESPEVRTAYQHTLMEELAYLDQVDSNNAPIMLSTVYPGPAHDPSIALVLAGPRSERIRWVDARTALIIPEEAGTQALIPASTPPHPAFEPYLRPLDTIALQSSDLDPGFTYYDIDTSSLESTVVDDTEANFGGAILLQQVQWLSSEVVPGDTAELITRWQVINPAKAGPIHPPAYTTDAVFFTHILGEDEKIVAQNDILGAPSWGWQTGDTILQIHSVSVPADTLPGNYSAVLGIYDRPTGQRLSLLGEEAGATSIQIPPLYVAQSLSSAQN